MMKTLPLVVGAALVVGLATGCRPEGTRERATSTEPRHYQGTGIVVGTTADHVKIDHQAIPGFMDAMTMSFAVKDPALLEGLEQGTKVRFRVTVAGKQVYIDRIEPLSEPEG